MLKFKLSGQELTYLDKGDVIVGGTVNYLEAEFEFDEAWSGYQTITAYFKNGAALHCMDITDGRIVPDDGLNLEPGMWDVYIRAVSYDDGGDEIAKQITSTTVRINALSHGRFGGSDFPSKPTPIYEQKYAEIVVAEAKRVEAESARNVFEEYSSGKTYVKGNKVSYGGSSYVLTVDEALGTNPTDKGSWLCIAEKGDKGEQGVQGVKGEKGDKGDKGVTGGKIFSYALGYGKNVEVGSYISGEPPYELINEGIDYGDIIVDTDGGCIFQYVCQLGGDGDDDAVLPANGLHCIANPNGEKGDKGDKGDDANVDKNTLIYRDEVSVLPETAKTGDVYKIAETIYEEGMYYIPMDMGGVGESDGIIRYYFDSVFGSDVIDFVTQMVEDGKINNFALFDGDVRFDIPLVGAGYDNGFYVDSTKKTYDYMGHNFKYILVPSEYGEDFFYGRNAVKFYKGELVVFTDKGWVSADAEMLKNIRYDLDDFKTEVGERFNSIDESYATIDLENVSNEDFKRKAEEAGVGGDDAGLTDEKNFMVFKDVVDALPHWANEGEVYKLLDSKFEIYRSGVESVADNFILENTRIQFYRYGGDTPEIVTIIAEAIAKSGGAPALVKLVLPDAKIEAVYTFTSNTYLYEDFSAECGPVIWTFSADRAEPIEYEYAYGPCDIYYSVKVGKSYVRFGSEWIPLVD